MKGFNKKRKSERKTILNYSKVFNRILTNEQYSSLKTSVIFYRNYLN